MNTLSTQPTLRELGALDEQAFTSLQSRFHGALILPSDAAYHEARHVWNGMIDKYPALIARCADVEDVITAVNFAREHNLLVAVRGGGHNVAGSATCDGGLVIDLSSMRSVQVDPAAQLAFVQGGAIWADVDQATQAYGLATPGGLVSTTGVAGLTLGGGLSWLRGKYGLSCDNLVAADIVTADGTLRHASETENSDLLWGLRGGGGNFGVVTNFTFRLHPVGPTVACLMILYPEEQARELLAQWQRFMATAPDEFSSNAFFWAVPSDPSLPVEAHGQRVLGLAGMYVGPVEEGEKIFQPLRQLATPVLDLSMPLPYVVKQTAVDAFFPAGTLRYYWKSLYLNSLSAEVIDALATLSATRPSSLTMVDLWAMGGAVARVPAEATAFGDRSAPFWLVFNTNWADPAESGRNIEWTRDFWRKMQPFAREGIYMNFPGLNEEGNRLVQESHGVNYERLVALKNKYDPTNFFRLNQNIQPTASGTIQ
jgi:FAD/FMN-containing dehydrogenase